MTLPVVVNELPVPRARLLLTVVVPVVAPMRTVVAAPPMLRLVAVELKRLAVVCSSCDEPPLTAHYQQVVRLPLGRR